MEWVLSQSASPSPLLPAVPGGTALFSTATGISLLVLMSSLENTSQYFRNKQTKSNKLIREYLASKKPKTTERQGEHKTSLQFRDEVKCESDVQEIVEYLLAVAKPLAAFLLDEFLNPLICFAKDKAKLLELIITNLCVQKCQNVI